MSAVSDAVWRFKLQREEMVISVPLEPGVVPTSLGFLCQ